MQPQYVSYELGELLQQKGFDIPCSRCYSRAKKPVTVSLVLRRILKVEQEYVPRPEYWVVLEWLKDKDMHVVIIPNVNAKGWFYNTYVHFIKNDLYQAVALKDESLKQIAHMLNTNQIFENYNAAIEAGITYFLKD